PVLGLMRAADLDEALALVDRIPFGLTSGIQSLDDREIARWLDRVAAGNLYVNRHITGAIVARQPFGGWKASVVGPGAKAGGPLSAALAARLGRCLAAAGEGAEETLRASAASYARAWREHFGREHEWVRLQGERNLFRYRPCGGVLV